jgi:hypothetical protein
MATAEGEDDFDPFSFEDFGDQPAAMYHAQSEAPFYEVNQVFSLLDLLYVIYAWVGADNEFSQNILDSRWGQPRLLPG